MAVTSGFFDSVSSDRKYNANQMSSIFDGIIQDGVFGSIGTAFAVTQNTGLSVFVGVGRAWFNHTWTYNDSQLSLTLDAADLTFPRIDTIVLEVNSGIAVRANSIKIVKGTPASSPVPPTLVNTSEVHQYPFADVRLNVGTASITQAMITNRVSTSACPLVTGPLSVISSSVLLAQWEAEFLVWFDEMKDQLSEDAAGALQLEIDALENGSAIEPGVILQSHLNSGASKIIARQGGSATDWDVPNPASPHTVTNYTPTKAAIQVGVEYVITAGNTFTVTFPVPFTAHPIILLTVQKPHSNDPFGTRATAQVEEISNTTFKAFAIDHKLGSSLTQYHTTVDVLIAVNWMAIGPVA